MMIKKKRKTKGFDEEFKTKINQIKHFKSFSNEIFSISNGSLFVFMLFGFMNQQIYSLSFEC